MYIRCWRGKRVGFYSATILLIVVLGIDFISLRDIGYILWNSGLTLISALLDLLNFIRSAIYAELYYPTEGLQVILLAPADIFNFMLYLELWIFCTDLTLKMVSTVLSVVFPLADIYPLTLLDIDWACDCKLYLLFAILWSCYLDISLPNLSLSWLKGTKSGA